MDCALSIRNVYALRLHFLLDPTALVPHIAGHGEGNQAQPD
jgi:hypothetical protein